MKDHIKILVNADKATKRATAETVIRLYESKNKWKGKTQTTTIKKKKERHREKQKSTVKIRIIPWGGEVEKKNPVLNTKF